MGSNADLGAVIRRFLPQLLQQKGVSRHQLKTLNSLAKCRTAELGGSVTACNSCGEIYYMMHSCRNRHCPCCQGIDREIWIGERIQEILPVKYFHAVFTVPHELLEIFRFNRKVMYNLLFEKSWETLCLFAKDPKLLGAKIGAIAVLHTWDQQMKFHPHIHFIIPAGGADEQGKWKASKQNGEFLFDVKNMSQTFSARFVKKLRKLKQQGKIRKYVPKNLITKPWVVYAKQAFGSPETIVEYLGRYSHRVAISNARIVKISDTHVTFRWCDRKNNHRTEYQTITGVDFLKRFIEHIVPPYFRRIRHLGFLSSRNKQKYLKIICDDIGTKTGKKVKLSPAEILEKRFGENSVLKCKSCNGTLVTIETIAVPRAPPAQMPNKTISTSISGF